MYHWLFTSVQAELGGNFPDDGETLEMAEYIAEEIWCKACLDGQLD